MSNKKETVGSLATELRNDIGLTQPQLAEKAGVSLATIQNIERGDQVRPSTIAKIYRDTLQVPDGVWDRIVGLWVAEAFGSSVAAGTLREVADSARIQENSVHENRVARLATVLPQLPENQQEQFVRFAELLVGERQIFGTIESFLAILDRDK